MTSTYELDPYALEKYRMCENELPTSRFSKVDVFYRYTYICHRNYITRRFAGGPVRHLLIISM